MDAAQRNVTLWTGVMTGPFAFAAVLETRYALDHYMCENHAHWLSWLIILAGLLLTGFGALCSWLGWTDETSRIRFMAISGLIISGVFALAILAMAIPDIFLRPCE